MAATHRPHASIWEIIKYSGQNANYVCSISIINVHLHSSNVNIFSLLLFFLFIVTINSSKKYI